MNRKWWKLIFLLPICLCLLYAGGYTAQFIRNYQVWSAAGNFAGNGTYPQAPSPHWSGSSDMVPLDKNSIMS